MQLSLAIATILASDVGCLFTLGICCSSFVAINAGTSGRDYLTPMGRTQYPSVAKSNQMVSRRFAQIIIRAPFLQYLRWLLDGQCDLRCSLLLLLVQMANMVWVVENPGSSVLFLHDRLRWLCNTLGALKRPVPWQLHKLHSPHNSMEQSKYQTAKVYRVAFWMSTTAARPVRGPKFGRTAWP